MKVWKQLEYWADDELIGEIAREILALAKEHGEPQPPCGLPVDMPIPFTFPQMSVDKPHVEYLLRRIGFLYQAVDRHVFWNKRIMHSSRAFDPIPEWAMGMPGMVLDPNWVQFEQAAMKIIERFIGTLDSYGLIRIEIHEPGYLSA